MPPTDHAVPVQNVMREDQEAPSYPMEEVLANAPQREDDVFRVRAILEF
ncbi:MAG TPA: Asp-tRNA(Asn)/Glu-tRNA(Gln) amidotransferase subunit GatC [Dehalococcoidia bacterium]|nr:Asp-tRNA(Asn)/Glu-tRNA(Gln) amidotransferase subunit GatC [Dehalococcoidia bacterium]